MDWLFDTDCVDEVDCEEELELDALAAVVSDCEGEIDWLGV